MYGAVKSSCELFESRFRHFNEPVCAGNHVFPNKTDHQKDLQEKLELDTSEILDGGNVFDAIVAEFE